LRFAAAIASLGSIAAVVSESSSGLMNQMEVVSELGVVYHQNHSLNLHLLTSFSVTTRKVL